MEAGVANVFSEAPKRRRGRQWERQKNSMFIKQNKNFTSASRGLAISSSPLFNYDLK